jgi:hypothetical protein
MPFADLNPDVSMRMALPAITFCGYKVRYDGGMTRQYVKHVLELLRAEFFHEDCLPVEHIEVHRDMILVCSAGVTKVFRYEEPQKFINESER